MNYCESFGWHEMNHDVMSNSQPRIPLCDIKLDVLTFGEDPFGVQILITIHQWHSSFQRLKYYLLLSTMKL